MMRKMLAIGVFALCASGRSMPWAPHCDIRKVHIGMTREEVLKVCPSPDREYNMPEASSYKMSSDELRESGPNHWMAWRHFSDDSDVVELKDGRVEYANSNRKLP